MLDRRRLLSLAPAALATAMWPRRARAVSAGQRRFLFVHAQGGWDPTRIFSPELDNPDIDTEDEASVASQDGLEWVDHPERPEVTAFLQANASRTAFLNGFEVRSITHTRCEQMLMTGSGTAADDWGAILAASSSESLSVPSLVLSGPSYTSTLASSVVRTGTSDQLEDLLSGMALVRSDQAPSLLSASALSAIDSALAARTDGLASATTGPTARYLEGYARAQTELAELQALGLSLEAPDDVPADCGGVFDQLTMAVNALASGATRCATVQYRGVCGVTFDDHAAIEQHGYHIDGLFAHLAWTLQLMDDTPGPAGGSMADETVIVVLSEMGRHPRINGYGGKDHWTFTSAMLVGGGIAGGRVVGAYDDYFLGRDVDLASGEPTDSGVSLTPAHLGATLLALGDVDPGDWALPEPITALMS